MVRLNKKFRYKRILVAIVTLSGQSTIKAKTADK